MLWPLQYILLMRSKELPHYSMPVAPENTFGLGIQVYKIESMLPRINSGKNERRQLIKQLENPVYSRKHEKLEKNNNLSYDRIEEKEDKVVKEANESIRRRSIVNTRSNTLNKLMIVKEKPERPPSVKIPSTSTAKKQRASNSKQVKTADHPGHNPPAQKQTFIKVFPPFEHQQLKQLSDKINEITFKRKQTKKTLRKQLRASRDENQQQRILKKLQCMDQTDVVEEIVNSEQLSPYDTTADYQAFGLEQYLMRENGLYEIPSDDEEVQPVYKPMVYVSEKLQQCKEKEHPLEEKFEKLAEKVQKQQLTRNQQ